jgi:hypothetical protein
MYIHIGISHLFSFIFSPRFTMSSGEESDTEVKTIPSIQEILQWKKQEMEDWLSRRRLPKSGRNKEVLASRIHRHIIGGDSSESDDDTHAGGDNFALPMVYPDISSHWENLTQPDQIPNVRQEDVTNYYIHGKNPVTGGLKNLNRYLEKAHKYSREPNYIGQIEVTTADSVSSFKAQVRPSMRKGLYLVEVSLYCDTGMIVGGRCQCKVGATGYCAHIGGLVLRLVRLKHPCTSELCSWNSPNVTKDIEPQTLREINWWPGKTKPAKPWCDQYQASQCNGEDDSNSFREQLLDKLKTANPNCSLYLTYRQSQVNLNEFWEKYSPDFQIGNTEDLNQSWIQEIFEDHMDNLTITTKLSSEIERATRGQSCNPLWKELRCFLLTASNFHDIAHMRETTAPECKVAYLCGYRNVPLTVPIMYGHKYEAKARKLYMKQHHTQCSTNDKPVSIKCVGLVISPQWPYLGASLDGLVECRKCGVGALEIKCPYKYRYVYNELSCIEFFCGFLSFMACYNEITVFVVFHHCSWLNNSLSFCTCSSVACS